MISVIVLHGSMDFVFAVISTKEMKTKGGIKRKMINMVFKTLPSKRSMRKKNFSNKGKKCKNNFCNNIAKAKGFCMSCYALNKKKESCFNGF